MKNRLSFPSSSLIRCCLLLAAATLLVLGGYGLRRHRPQAKYATIPFLYGTNSVIDFERRVQTPGGYWLYVVLSSASPPQTDEPFPPMILQTKFHVLITTNGQPALEQDVVRLDCTSVSKNTATYSLAFFSAPKDAVVRCYIQDLSDGTIRVPATLNLKKFYK